MTLKNFVLIIAICFMHSCSKRLVEQRGADYERPETSMTTPDFGQVVTGQIWFDSSLGHYRSAMLDFGSTLTHPSSGWATGDAGVGIHSIENLPGEMVSNVQMSGDRFVVYMPTFLGSAPPLAPTYSTRKITQVYGYEVDLYATQVALGTYWLDSVRATPLIRTITDKYYSFDTIRLKQKGGKLKRPAGLTDITNEVFGPGTDGLIEYKGRILMDANSPSGMSIFSYNTVANNETYQPISGTGLIFLPVFYEVDSTTRLIFTARYDLGLGTASIVSCETENPAAFLTSFVGSVDNIVGLGGPSGSYYLTFQGLLPDGRHISIDNELQQWGN